MFAVMFAAGGKYSLKVQQKDLNIVKVIICTASGVGGCSVH